tara:strand:+ start:636 stop:812 length:177 start_codon:yes stop_codon:yes gene_type:complete
MKIGDLVKTQKLVENKLVDRYGIIVETGKWTGNKDLRVLWDTESGLENSSKLILLASD